MKNKLLDVNSTVGVDGQDERRLSNRQLNDETLVFDLDQADVEKRKSHTNLFENSNKITISNYGTQV